MFNGLDVRVSLPRMWVNHTTRFRDRFEVRDTRTYPISKKVPFSGFRGKGVFDLDQG